VIYTDVKTDLFFCYQQWRCKRLRHDHPQERINFRSTYMRRRVNNRWEEKNRERERKKRSMKNRVLNRVLSNNFCNIYATKKIQYAQLLFAMYITITFVRMWVSKQLSCTDFLIVVVVVVDQWCLHNFLFTYP